MPTISRVRRQVSRLLFGSTSFPQFCNLSLAEPQSFIRVTLCGHGFESDVTGSHVIAATRPLTIAVACEDWPARRTHLVLRFHESNGQRRLLGEWKLRQLEAPADDKERFRMFRPVKASNHCYSPTHAVKRRMHLVFQQWREARSGKVVDIRMPSDELWALFIYYICPRPVFLVSFQSEGRGNMLPMDLVGPISREHFTLALHNTSTALPIIEKAGRVAISSVPADQMNTAYRLGKNHRSACIAWESLPFAVTFSESYGIPIPDFSLRVRELQVEFIRPLGSHTFIVSKVTSDKRRAEGPQFFQAHGCYEPWRLQGLKARPEGFA